MNNEVRPIAKSNYGHAPMGHGHLIDFPRPF